MSMLFKRIKDWATTITAFRTGDVIPVDGPQGTAKMSKDDLLRETAENIGNDLDASATSALLPYGKTFALQKSNLIGLKFGYVVSDGTIQSSLLHKYAEIPLGGIKSISVTLPGGGFSDLYAVVYQDEGGVWNAKAPLNVGGEIVVSIPVQLGGKLYLNYFSTFGDITFSVEYYKADIVKKIGGIVADERIVMKSNAGLVMPEGLSLGRKLTIDPFAITPYKAGYYIARNGAETYNSKGAYFVFDVHGIKSIKITGLGLGLSTIFHVIIEYPNGERQTWMQTNETSVTITFQKGEIAKVYINRFEGISLSWEIEWYTKQEMVDFDTRTFPNVVRKPFNWSTKKVLVVGDSIARGFVNGTTVTRYTWSYWLNQKLGFASLTNGAVGGATFTDSTYKIKTQLENHHTDDVNLIFICGGVNDWMIGASYLDVYNAVTEVIGYIKDNYPANTEIIFVTPIEPGGYHLYDKTKRTGLDSLDDIRQAITDAAIANDTDNLISVVDGKTFGFPNVEGKSSFISVAFGDRLHPSELGYRNIYAPALLERIV